MDLATGFPLVWAALLFCLLAPTLADVNGSVAPIIGILSQETRYNTLISTHYDCSSHIAASYVKFIEGAGGRVVPILIGGTYSYYEQLLKKINGVLLPGGSVFFNNTNGYGDAGEHIVQIAKQINDNGTFFPVWGTCLGMELLVLKMSNNTETRSDCKARSISLPLEFKTDFKQSRLFAGLSDDLEKVLVKENVTYNYHQFCYTEQSFSQPPLNGNWRIISLNHDREDVEFVSSIEHVKYPFYGVQFHPEKPIYEFVSAFVPHTTNSIRIGQYFADFFVNEARKNTHIFENSTEQQNVLIYNYDLTYTSLIGSSYEQQYLFKDLRNSATKKTLYFGLVLGTLATLFAAP